MAACQDQNEIQPPMMCPDLPDHGARVQLPAHVLAPQLPNQPAASALQLPLAQVQLPAPAPASALQLRHQPPASFLQIPDAALLLICKAGSKRWEAGPYTAQALRCTCRSLRASVDSLIDHLCLNTAIKEVQQGLGRQSKAANAFLRGTLDSLRGFPSRANIQELTLRFDLPDAETYMELPSLLPSILMECGQRLRSVQGMALYSDVVFSCGDASLIAAACPHLCHLELTGTPLCGPVLWGLTSLTNLSSLCLDSVHLPHGCAGLGPSLLCLPHLTDLELRDDIFKEEGSHWHAALAAVPAHTTQLEAGPSMLQQGVQGNGGGNEAMPLPPLPPLPHEDLRPGPRELATSFQARLSRAAMQRYVHARLHVEDVLPSVAALTRLQSLCMELGWRSRPWAAAGAALGLQSGHQLGAAPAAAVGAAGAPLIGPTTVPGGQLARIAISPCVQAAAAQQVLRFNAPSSLTRLTHLSLCHDLFMSSGDVQADARAVPRFAWGAQHLSFLTSLPLLTQLQLSLDVAHKCSADAVRLLASLPSLTDLSLWTLDLGREGDDLSHLAAPWCKLQLHQASLEDLLRLPLSGVTQLWMCRPVEFDVGGGNSTAASGAEAAAGQGGIGVLAGERSSIGACGAAADGGGHGIHPIRSPGAAPGAAFDMRSEQMGAGLMRRMEMLREGAALLARVSCGGYLKLRWGATQPGADSEEGYAWPAPEQLPTAAPSTGIGGTGCAGSAETSPSTAGGRGGRACGRGGVESGGRAVISGRGRAGAGGGRGGGRALGHQALQATMGSGNSGGDGGGSGGSGCGGRGDGNGGGSSGSNGDGHIKAQPAAQQGAGAGAVAASAPITVNNDHAGIRSLSVAAVAAQQGKHTHTNAADQRSANANTSAIADCRNAAEQQSKRQCTDAAAGGRGGGGSCDGDACCIRPSPASASSTADAKQGSTAAPTAVPTGICTAQQGSTAAPAQQGSTAAPVQAQVLTALAPLRRIHPSRCWGRDVRLCLEGAGWDVGREHVQHLHLHLPNLGHLHVTHPGICFQGCLDALAGGALPVLYCLTVGTPPGPKRPSSTGTGSGASTSNSGTEGGVPLGGHAMGKRRGELLVAMAKARCDLGLATTLRREVGGCLSDAQLTSCQAEVARHKRGRLAAGLPGGGVEFSLY